MPYWICKRANKEYIPLWMYIVEALLFIFDGVVNLVILPFGYLSGLSTSWAGNMLRHSVDVQRAKKGKGKLQNGN